MHSLKHRECEARRLAWNICRPFRALELVRCFPWAGAHGYSLSAALRPQNNPDGQQPRGVNSPRRARKIEDNRREQPPEGAEDNRRGRKAPEGAEDSSPE